MKMLTFDQLMLPTLNALESLGGSGSIEEIASAVIQALNLPDTVTSQAHNPEKSSQTEVEYLWLGHERTSKSMASSTIPSVAYGR